MGYSPQAQNALETTYRRYADMLYRIALSYTERREDAEDAVHDVFIKYLEKAPFFADETHEEAWFVRVTINRSLDIVRARGRRSFAELDENSDVPDTDENGASDILRAVNGLPPKYKSVILLHCLEGKTVESTAMALGLSVSAVKMRLMRGREMLRAKMESEGRAF